MLKKTSNVGSNEQAVYGYGQQNSFVILFDRLTNPVVLALIKIGTPYMIDFEARQNAIGVIFCINNDSKWNDSEMFDYYFKTPPKGQCNYSATKECYAVVFYVLTLQPYLQVAFYKAHTNHVSVKNMLI